MFVDDGLKVQDSAASCIQVNENAEQKKKNGQLAYSGAYKPPSGPLQFFLLLVDFDNFVLISLPQLTYSYCAKYT